VDVRLPRFPSCEGRVAWTLIDGTCVLWSARFWTSRSRTSVSSCHVSSFDSRVMWFTLLHGLNISQNNLKVEACTTYHCSLACVAHRRTPQRRTPPTFLHPPFTTHNFTTRPAMDKAIEDLQAREGGEELGYRNTARIFGVAESTLRRRH
jgi:hypothetical protein